MTTLKLSGKMKEINTMTTIILKVKNDELYVENLKFNGEARFSPYKECAERFYDKDMNFGMLGKIESRYNIQLERVIVAV